MIKSKRNPFFKKSISVCLIMMLLSAFAIHAVAAADPIDPIDTDEVCTLTVQFLDQSNYPIDGAVFHLYKVGDVTRTGAFRINEPFASVYDPDDEWKDVVTAMRNYIHSENLSGSPIAPLMTRTTDDNGVARFASDDDVTLRCGLYLVESVPREYSEAHGPFAADDTFEATPFLVRLPNFDGENHDGEHEVWNYDVVAAPKQVIYSGNSFWIHYKDNSERIGGATVTGMPHLLNEEFHLDDVRLRYFANAEDVLQPYSKNSGASDSNTFVLDKNCDPQAEGYTFIGWNTDPDADVGYSTAAFSRSVRDYTVYAIWEKVNHGSSETPSESPGTESPGTESPGTESPGTESPDESVTSNEGGGGGKKDPILPQTGVLWWPVPVLAILGFVVFLAGAYFGRKKGEQKASKTLRSNTGILLITGIMLVSSSLALVLYNGWDNMRAGSDTAKERARIVRVIPGPDDKTTDVRLDNGKSVTEMPVKRIQGDDFAAMLQIPSLSLDLPVRNTWSYPGLRRSPCRYTGSAYTDNLVICGHNYGAHFGNIKRLNQGDEVTLTAMNGDVFRYQVAEVTELSPLAYGEMITSNYELTLFTCTIGGSKRVTVRCTLTGFNPHDKNLISSEYALF